MAITTTAYLCIGCPLGCRLEVDEFDPGDEVDPGNAGEVMHSIVEVRGFQCRRGKEYAIQEHTAPQRTVTTTVGIKGAIWPRLPVRTSRPIPKDRVIAVCRQLAAVNVEAPVQLGQVIVVNVAGTGCDVIATRDMPII